MSYFSRKGRRTTPVVVASSSTTNKREVWEVSKPGSLSALELRKDVPLTALDEDKVRVEVKCIGLNFADVFTVLGLYGATPKNETFIPGLEFSGVCVEEGKGGKEVRKFEIAASKSWDGILLGAFQSGKTSGKIVIKL